uniref:Small ribosomal subunit protein bS20c n=1 Tax=Kuetzingia canaliculata TaxID=228262 RepID=A0A1Z1MQ30_KUECA|nr:ribosomal protein S20 [Kuetzingia canaliculata]ARW67871.1 ribosomal protein S20 [Kuetzingia canaliculata]
MSQILSNSKSTRIILRNLHRNKKYKSLIKTAIKKYLSNLKDVPFSEKKLEICKNNLSFIYEKIDKAVKKRVLHKNTAARKKSKLAKMIRDHNIIIN